MTSDTRAARPAPMRGSPGLSFREFVLAALVAVVLLALALLLSGRQIFWGASTITFLDEGGVASAVAQRAIETGVVERIGDDELTLIVEGLRSGAAGGDPRAALVVFQIVRLQQQQEGAGNAP